MLGTSASPLRKALNDSGLGESIIGGGVEDELRQPVFSLGLKVGAGRCLACCSAGLGWAGVAGLWMNRPSSGSRPRACLPACNPVLRPPLMHSRPHAHAPNPFQRAQGVKEGDAPKVEALVLGELQRLEKEGFSATAVEAAVNTIEFSLR